MKALRPVVARSAFAHGALVLATLDPAVRSIVPPADPEATADLLMVDGARVRLLVVEDGAVAPMGAADDPGLRVVSRDGGPTSLHSFLIWACRRQRMDYSEQEAVVARLRARGPLPIADLADLVTSSPDPLAAVLGLACRDVVEIDVRQPPGPDATVRARERG